VNSETWQKLDDLFLKYPFLCSEQVTESEIEKVVLEMGLSFPSDYQEFIRRYGGAIVGALPIFGLRKADPMGEDEWHIAEINKKYKDDHYPILDNWVIVSVDQSDNPIGINTEGTVVLFDHNSKEIVKVAENFEEFISSECLRKAS
jgi:cell wall assembly regulator SMI1